MSAFGLPPRHISLHCSFLDFGGANLLHRITADANPYHPRKFTQAPISTRRLLRYGEKVRHSQYPLSAEPVCCLDKGVQVPLLQCDYDTTFADPDFSEYRNIFSWRENPRLFCLLLGRPWSGWFCGDVHHHILGLHAVGLSPLRNSGMMDGKCNTVYQLAWIEVHTSPVHF